MPILQPKDQQAVRQRLDVELKRDVNITLYTQKNVGGLYIPGRECKSCAPTQQLLEEVSALSPRLHLEIVDFYGGQEDARARGVEMIPATVVSTDGGDSARFYGLPSGYEFAVLLDAVIAASSKQSSLGLETRRSLKGLQEDVNIQVFVTPTCQYCPSVARVAHAMAVESPRVVANVVEVLEFPHLAQAYRVVGVPKTVINDAVEFTGAVTEQEFLKRILEAVGVEQPEEDGEERVSDQTTRIA